MFYYCCFQIDDVFRLRPPDRMFDSIYLERFPDPEVIGNFLDVYRLNINSTGRLGFDITLLLQTTQRVNDRCSGNVQHLTEIFVNQPLVWNQFLMGNQFLDLVTGPLNQRFVFAAFFISCRFLKY